MMLPSAVVKALLFPFQAYAIYYSPLAYCTGENPHYYAEK